MPLLTSAAALLATIVAIGLWSRLGFGRALMAGLAAGVLSVSAVALVCLDARAFERDALLGGLLGALLGWSLLVAWLRARWPARATLGWDRTQRLGLLGLLVVLVIGTGIRLDPSPYLHGGQDQGIYVNVGHHIARTGRLRAVDRVMAGEIEGVDREVVVASHEIIEPKENSPLAGVREGRWLAGIHVEDASEGRSVPAFFHLLPVWFALAELDFGFARSTWPLVMFASLSLLAAFALGHRLAAGDDPTPGDRARGVAVGLIAATSLAVHPLDLWISTFTVTENLARAALLGAAVLGLEAERAERRGEPGAVLLGALAGSVFAAGAFARGSMLALAIVLALVLVLVRRGAAPRSRMGFFIALVIGATLATVQAILHSYPYFFNAAHNHFYIPRLHPRQSHAVAWVLVGGAALLGLDRLARWARRRKPSLDGSDRLARMLALSAMLLAMLAVVVRALDDTDAYAWNQQVTAVLLRYSGPVGLALGVVGLLVAAWRADHERLAWVLLAAAIVLATAQKPGIRYEFYYARYLVGDVIPVLVIASAWCLGECSRRIASRFGARSAALGLGLALLACWAPNVRTLNRPVYWTRDLEHSPEDLSAMLEQVPDGALLFFDAREPLRWRGILAVPAWLAFDQDVLVYPNIHMVEDAVSAGTPVYMLSGGWEQSDQQRWPNENGPWRTTVVARGHYRAERAEILEGEMPQRLTEWGGPWELQRIDRSIWRGTGAFSLYPGSDFIAIDEPGRLESVVLELRWEPGANVELLVGHNVLSGCEIDAKLVDEHQQVWLLGLVSLPSDRVIRFSLPTSSPHPLAGQPITGKLALSWRCEVARAVEWQRLSLRWDTIARDVRARGDRTGTTK
jgi:hypothetical protein